MDPSINSDKKQPICILHIGIPKTGTTTIQSFLRKNRSRLANAGILYPRAPCPDGSNGSKLVAYAYRDTKAGEKRPGFRIRNRAHLRRFRERFRRHLEREIASYEDARVVVLSNEAIQARLSRRDEILRLRELVKNVCSDIKVLVYIRRQDRARLSGFYSRVKNGALSNHILNAASKKTLRQYRYFQRLRLYEEVFGIDNLIIRRFEPDQLVDGDVLTDFGKVVGFDPATFSDRLPRRNVSPDPLVLDFLGRLNKALRCTDPVQSSRFRRAFLNHLRGNEESRTDSEYQLADLLDGCRDVAEEFEWDDETLKAQVLGDLERCVDEEPMRVNGLVTRDEAAAFYSMFRKNNVKLRDRYFPSERGALFQETFDEYPVTVS